MKLSIVLLGIASLLVGAGGSAAVIGYRAARCRSGPQVTRIDPANYRVHLDVALSDNHQPWGWLVHGGREANPPAGVSSSAALVFDKTGAFSILTGSEINAARRAGSTYEAVESKPALLVGNGDVPARLPDELTELAVGETRDHEILVVRAVCLSAPEMAVFMGALGARRAVAFDHLPITQNRRSK